MKHYLSVIALIVIAFWSIYPSIKDFTTSIPENYDGLFITWTLNQTIDKIPNDLPHLFDGNIFWPHKNVKAYSDLLIPSALLAYIPVKLTGIPVVAFNFNFVVGHLAVILISYFWFYEMSKSRTSSFIAAVAFGLSQIKFSFYGALQMWALQWFLLSAWMLWKYANSGKVKYFYISAFFFVVQMWESFLPAFWVVTIAALLLPSMWKYLKHDWQRLLRIAILPLVSILPVLWLYSSFYQEFHAVRSIRDTAHFAMSVDDLWKGYLSPGLFLLLFIVILAFLRHGESGSESIRRNFYLHRFRLRSGITKDLMFFALLGVISFILSLGPVLKWSGHTVKLGNLFLPLPYGILYYIVPGFGAFRTPSRFIWLFGFALSGIAAILFPKLPKLPKLLTLFLFSLPILSGTKLSTVYPIPTPQNYHPIYKELKSLPGDVILELPIYSSAAPGAQEEVLRMLYSLDHKKHLVNGYSGFFPPDWQELVKDLNENYPSEELDKRMKETGVDYIILHGEETKIKKL